MLQYENILKLPKFISFLGLGKLSRWWMELIVLVACTCELLNVILNSGIVYFPQDIP